jgi:hypothetical protein
MQYSSRRSGFIRIMLLLVIYCTSSRAADPLDNWHWRNPLPQGNPLYDIVFGDDRFVAVGDRGVIISSTDGVDWTLSRVPVNFFLSSIAFGNGLFVASHPGSFWLSTNAVTWTKSNFEPDTILTDISFLNGRFFCVEYTTNLQPTLLSSTNALEWESQYIPTNNISFAAPVYGNGLYVLVGSPGVIYTSADTKIWTRRDPPTHTDFYSAAFGNGVFVALGSGGRIFVSQDAINWSQIWVSPSYLNGLDFANGLFIAAGRDIFTSPDGNTWTPQSSDKSFDFPKNSTTYGAGKYICVGSRGAILSSVNASQWTHLQSETSVPLTSMTVGQDRLIGVGFSGGVISSLDAIGWHRETSGTTNTLRDVAYGPTNFVAVGDKGTIICSTNGIHWTNRSGGFVIGSNNIRSVAFGQGTYVAVGDVGLVSSTNATRWTARNPGGSYQFMAVTFANDRFIATGIRGLFQATGAGISTSTNGISWTSVYLTNYATLYCAAFGNGRYVVGGEGSAGAVFYVSSDSLSWSRYLYPQWPRITALAFARGHFVAVGWQGGIYSSINGADWQKHDPGMYFEPLQDVVVWNSSFVTIGVQTEILQSDPLMRLSIDRAGCLFLSGPVGRSCAIEWNDPNAMNQAWVRTAPFRISMETQPLCLPDESGKSGRLFRAVLTDDVQ